MRRMHLAVFAVALLACGTSGDSTCDGGDCVDAGSVPPVSGGGCDSSKPASQGGCAVSDGDGFFVSPTGSDTGTGSKSAPFKTIGRGILAAAGAPLKPNVYICAGTYPENLVIQSAPAGVALHGGFDCATYTQMNLPTTVAPAYTGTADSAYVLSVVGAAALVESMTLTAPDPTDPGVASVAAFVNGSPGMTFRRAAVSSGRGADATSPVAPAPAAANSKGNDATSDTALAPAKTCPCSSDSTVGGSGGIGPISPTAPMGGAPTIPSDPDAGAPGQLSACTGGNGASGLVGSTGASATSYGMLTASGWTGGAGAAGATGGTAQGGGGGGYLIGGPSNAGGSGGCGGCGGKGGVGAPGGGTSIAVAALNSTLRIQASTIHAGSGGAGANGAAGQGGQPGGAGGASSPFTNGACPGGSGGTGGTGGPGGGGAGGASIAVATVGSTPDIDSFSTVVAGTAGHGGLDGAGVSKAVDGVAATVQAF